MGFLRKLLGLGPKVDVQELLNKGAVVIDVREVGEFQGGHFKGSKNIPLGQIPHKIEELKKINKPILLCCKSGMRSGMALKMLKQKGVENAFNGGSWRSL